MRVNRLDLFCGNYVKYFAKRNPNVFVIVYEVLLYGVYCWTHMISTNVQTNSHIDLQTHASSASDNRVTLTFDL